MSAAEAQQLADTIQRLERWANARERRNTPGGHGREGTALLRTAAAELVRLVGERERLVAERDRWKVSCEAALAAQESLRAERDTALHALREITSHGCYHYHDPQTCISEHGEEVCARCIAVNALAAAGEPNHERHDGKELKPHDV